MNSTIAYLCSSVSWGGLEMNHLRNAKWMQDRGHDIVVIGVKNSPYLAKADEMKLPIITINLHKKYYDFKKGKQLAAILQKNAVSHLFIRSTYDMSITATVKSTLKNEITTAYFMEMQLGVKKTNFLHSLRFNFIDVWSTPLDWLNKQVKTMTHYKGKLITIPSGLELNQFDNKLSQQEARKQLGLPEGLTFGLIGRFDKAKGQLLLLKALQRMHHKDVHIALLGEPTRNEGDDYFDEMKKFIREHQLENNVSILPFRDDTSVFYTAIDWLVMATKAETFGMVTIEALASGRPVLGSNKGGTPEILNTNQGGLLFESMNPKDLAKKINQIIEENISFSSTELKSMSKTYDHEHVCEMIEKEFRLN